MFEVSRLGGSSRERRVEEHGERVEREDVKLDVGRSRVKNM